MGNWERLVALADQIRWLDVVIAMGIIALFVIGSPILTRLLFSLLTRMFRASEHVAKWRQAFEGPFRICIGLLGVYLGVSYFLPSAGAGSVFLDQLFRSAVIILSGRGLYVLSAQSVLLEGISKKINLDASSMLIPFLSKVLRFMIIATTITLVSSEWGFSINGMVAGMGLGSLALALAAKDTLGNILGGIVIVLEKPFSKGDWISTSSVEGIVEDITFRSTKIRTFADAVVTVPNASLADQPITNVSRMGKRRITFTLNVAIDSDMERLRAAIHVMNTRLMQNEKIDQDTIIVKFTEFNESSLGIFFYFFTKSTVWMDYLSTRQEVNLDIMQILEQENIKLAYPSQRIFIEEKAQARQRAEA